MEELTIEDKKYVSSKRAAQMTGYAKDYIGQLCREGRVPARLVGRNWYVLEAAIQDHRFGAMEPREERPIAATVAEDGKVEKERKDAPWYTASSRSPFPPLNRLDANEPVQNLENPAQLAQDSWKEWFDRFDSDKQITGKTDGEGHEEEKEEQEGKAAATEEESVPVPIHAYSPQVRPYQAPPEEFLPRVMVGSQTAATDYNAPQGASTLPRRHRTLARTFQTAGIVLALCMAVFALLGSGIFDSYVISGGRASVLSGIYFYKR